MKLTNKNAWHVFAGGTGASEDKNSYQAITTIGNYHVDPVSLITNVQKHLGYIPKFSNLLGKVDGGLWLSLSTKTVDLRTARRLCQEHLEKHQGKINIPS